jgi:probable phosphoglycerate mutase
MLPTFFTEFCVVRHGETAWNTQRRLQGHRDIALNAMGEQQARAAGRHLAGLHGQRPFTRLVSSDLDRAARTAALIGEALPGLAPAYRADLRERCYGAFEGLTYDEAKQAYPEAYRAFETRVTEVLLPGGGESLQAFNDRVVACLGQLAAAYPGERVILVTHGGVLDILNRFARGRPLSAPRDFFIPNAGLNWLGRTAGEGDAAGPWAIGPWGETAHLSAVSLDELPG